MSQTRRLAAILAADVAGYSRLMGADEEGTLERLKALRRELLDPTIAAHKGRIVKTTGDGLLVEFASVVDAVRCAVAVQQAMAEWNTGVAADNRIELRIGIHQGDIVVEDGDIFGDGVNVAARLEGLAEPGGICVSARVQEDAAGRLDLAFEDMGEQALKNIARPVRGYRVTTAVGSVSVRAGSVPAVPDKPSIAVLPFANMSGDPEQEYFVDGMVEEIITALSRIRWLFVIARNSSFTYKGRAIDVSRSAASWACATCSKALCAKPATGCASPGSGSTRPPAHISGPIASTARSKKSSTSRTRWHRALPGSSSRRCRPPRPRVRPTV